jgi:hypothetical protein
MENAEQPVDYPRAPEAREIRPLRKLNLAVSLAICFSAWLLPGMGHFVLGRWVRGIIFTTCILVMFMMGLAMEGLLYGTVFEQPLHIFAFVANVGVGLPYFLAQRIGAGLGTMTSPTYDYGTTFLWVAGLLNYLVVLDAFDIAQGRKP